MTPARFRELSAGYGGLRVVVVGDVCLDRYLDIDPALSEISIETGLPVHNVTGVRPQPGAAGTIVNNLVALGVGHVAVVGFTGEDGEGWELRRALQALPGADVAHLVATPLRRTFTYCKPTVHEPGRPPRELSRLDTKNRTPTPPAVEERILAGLRAVAPAAHAIIVMDQVDLPETGVVTARVRDEVARIAAARPGVPVPADCRRGLAGWPAVDFKMNAVELAAMTGAVPAGPPQSHHGGPQAVMPIGDVRARAMELARRTGRMTVVTLSERGLCAALPGGRFEHVPALPLRGPIDVVGAGDSVTANLAAALAGGADLREALLIAAAASSVVIHKLGTTGTADRAEIAALLG